MSPRFDCVECGLSKPWAETVWCRYLGQGARMCFECLPEYERYIGPIKRDPGKVVVVRGS